MADKKWFLYLGDRHEGPFTLDEIAQKVASGVAASTHYVWTEGMADWKVMSSLPEFAEIVGSAAGAANDEGVLPFDASPTKTNWGLKVAVAAEKPLGDKPLGEKAFGEMVKSSAPIELEEPNLNARETKKKSQPMTVSPAPVTAGVSVRGGPSKVKRILGLLVLVGIPGLIAIAYFGGQLDPVLKHPLFTSFSSSIGEKVRPLVLKGIDAYPPLGKWISPISHISELSEADNDELRSAASAILSSEGARVALAVPSQDMINPTFYVASNLPDGAELDVFVRGNGETLLNQLEFTAQTKARLTGRIAKTEPVKDAAGKSFPKGEYFIYVVEADQQPAAVAKVLSALTAKPAGSKVAHPDWLPPNRKVSLFRSLFLGGKQDASYQAKLKEYHEGIATQAKNELVSLRKIFDTTLGQMNASSQEINRLKKQLISENQAKKPVKPKKGAKGKPTRAADVWQLFDKKWVETMAPVMTSYETWKPETIPNEYFYSKLVEVAQVAINQVLALHKLHQDFAAQPPKDLKEFDTKSAEAASSAQIALTAFKTKLELMEKLPPSPSGLPQKEGL